MQPTYKRNPGQTRMRELLTSVCRFCLIYGGSRSGKTFEIVGSILERALLAPGSRHLIVRQEGTSAKRSIVKGTLPEVIALRWPGLSITWKEQYGYFLLPNGSEIWVGGLNDLKALDKILGNEYATIYINEASEVTYEAFTLLRSRLAQTVTTIQDRRLSQRFYVDLNPTTTLHWTHRIWIDGVDPVSGDPVDPAKFGHCVVNPQDNAENLSEDYLADLDALPERARRRFRDGAYSADDDNALWRRSFIRHGDPKPKTRIVVAIDPAAKSEPGSDETGIIVAAECEDGTACILEDASDRFRPEEWARRAISLFDLYGADLVVAEINQGGEMVEATIKAQSLGRVIPFRALTATRGKHVRAEPVAALYEMGKVTHARPFPELESQMCAFTLGFDRGKAGYSPDRVDALVWALTELFPSLAMPAVQDSYEPTPLPSGGGGWMGV